MPPMTKRLSPGRALEESRSTAELAAESLRLTNLRYQGGASPASEVVDAETALVTARNAYADAQVRYRTLLATSSDIYGKFLSDRKHYQQIKELEQIHAISLDESNGKGPAWPAALVVLLAAGITFLRLRSQGRSRSIAHRDRAGGRRGKRADPAQGGYGRGAVPARSSGDRAQGRLVGQEVVRGQGQPRESRAVAGRAGEPGLGRGR